MKMASTLLLELSPKTCAVPLTETELARIPNLGKKSVEEIKRLVHTQGMTLDTKVKNWPSQLRILQLRSEYDNKDELPSLDFQTLEDAHRSNLLKPLSQFNLSRRCANALSSLRIQMLGDLVQLDHAEVGRIPGLGRKSTQEIENLLEHEGFKLGTIVRNWPKPDELTVYAAMERKVNVSKEIIPGEPFSTLEEELQAAVEFAVPSRGRQIMLRRTGWDGGKRHTLAEIASSTDLSGCTSVVTRERIRQIESAAIAEVRNRTLEMQRLDKVLDFLTRNSPISSTDATQLLIESGLTNVTFAMDQIIDAARAFRRSCGFCLINNKKYQLVIPCTILDPFRKVQGILLEHARMNDYIKMDDIAHQITRESFDKYSMIKLVVNTEPRLNWLDEESGLIWSRTRTNADWNKSLNVCAKVLSVTDRTTLSQLLQSVTGSRNVVKVPSREALFRMLDQDIRFDVTDETVRLKDVHQESNISETDLKVLRAAAILGPVVRFKELSEYLIQQGMSTNHAQLTINLSPLLTRVSRGKYRFVCSPNEAKVRLSTNDAIESDSDRVIDESMVLLSILVSQRTLFSGKHEITNSSIGTGDWLVIDSGKKEVGRLRTNGDQVLDLRILLEQESVVIGQTVLLEFNKANKTVTLVH